jgi:predicted TPR repeat methyltransferase
MTEQEKLNNYYAARAKTYEANYDKPERQADLAALQERVAATLHGHHVLELACGTSYWTERYAAGAASVLATDVVGEVLDVAKAKNLQKKFSAVQIEFALADVFDLTLPADRVGDEAFTACFGGFLWSHIKREQQGGLLAHWRKKLGSDALVVLIDNNYVEGNSTVIARTDLEGNTYQIRTQEDGSRVEVIKNFPTDSTLRKKIGTAARDIRIVRSEYFWMLTCRLK